MSIYESIKAAAKENERLPADFSLNEKVDPNEMAFAPGAMDGIWIYHGGIGGTSDGLVDAVASVISLIEQYLDTNDERCLDKLDAILTEYRALHIVDPMLNGIRENHEGIELQKLIEFAFETAQTSDSIEMVKTCISLLGLFDLEKYESIRTVVAILGLYDEFTLFSVVAAAKWTDGTGLIFWIAQRANGWGKIHAVERLEPETDKIREWILREGCSNGVMDAYLGLICANKGDLIAALRQEHLDSDLFESVSIIIDALIDEGPVPGISEYEHAQKALELYLRHAKEQATTLSHLWYVLNIRRWADDEEIEYSTKVLDLCNEILTVTDWNKKIYAALEEKGDVFHAVNAASRMDVDISDMLYTIVKREPLEYYFYFGGLFKKPEMAAELIALYEKVLPLDEMPQGMGDFFFADTLRKEHGCLDYVLPLIADYPMHGIKSIKTGLNSPVVRSRNMACRAMSGWTKMLEKPIADISPELLVELQRIIEIEVNDDTKETMRKLIAGEVADEDD